MLRIGCAPRFIYYKLLEAPYIKAAHPCFYIASDPLIISTYLPVSRNNIFV